MTTKKVPIEEIELDEQCQARAKIDPDAVAEYKAAYENGVELPPLEVFSVSGKLYLVDGFHRFPAAHDAGLSFIKVKIAGKGTIDDAVMYATSVNQTHGVRRSNADKRRAVRMVFDIGHGADTSDHKIAEHCGVSHTLVGKIRAEWESAQLETDSSSQRTGRDGKKRKAPKRNKDSGPAGEGVTAGEPRQETDPHASPPGSELPDEPPPETTQPMPPYGPQLTGAAKVIGQARREAKKLLESAPVDVMQETEKVLRRVESRLKLAAPVVCPRCEGEGCKRCAHHGWVTEGVAHDIRQADKRRSAS